MSTRRGRRARAGGFTLLEAIVAMVVMATCLLALYGWLSTNTISLNRAQVQLRSVEDARTALSLIDTVNPMSEPAGQRGIGPLQCAGAKNRSRAGVGLVCGMARSSTRTVRTARGVLREGRIVRDFKVRKPAGARPPKTGTTDAPAAGGNSP